MAYSNQRTTTMSNLTTTHVAVPAGATALQVAALGSTEGKLGEVSIRITMTAATRFDGKPVTVDPGVFSFQESANGSSWSTLGSPVTVSGEKSVTLMPSKALFRILAKTSGGRGGAARLDVQYVGRLGRGQLEWRTFGGKEGFTYAGDPSTDPTGKELGLSTAAGNTPSTWPPTLPPTP